VHELEHGEIDALLDRGEQRRPERAVGLSIRMLPCGRRFEQDERHTWGERTFRLRDEKYAIQRLGRRIGLFGDGPSAETVTLRLDPCP